MGDLSNLKKAMVHLDKAYELLGGADLDSVQRSKLDSLLWDMQARIDVMEQEKTDASDSG